MLSELTVVEQRYLAVREVLDTGALIKDVALRYGVDRRTIHRWLVRYASEGLGALADRSSRPDRCPHQMPAEVESRVVAMRRAHPGWGPRTIGNRLRRELEAPPSRSAIYRCLVRHGLIDPTKRKRRRTDYKRWERSRAMELWQIDMGDVSLANGMPLSVVTGIDDHSRFCVMARFVERATARPVCDALLEALHRHGIPEQILTDNAKVFTGRLHNRPTSVLFDRICLNNGIKHILRRRTAHPPVRARRGQGLRGRRRRASRSRAAASAAEGRLTPCGPQRAHLHPQAPLPRRPLPRRPMCATCSRPSLDSIVTAWPRRLGCLRSTVHLLVNGVVVATHARRHLPEDTLPEGSTLRSTSPPVVVSFAGTGYRVGNAYRGEVVGVRLVGDTVQITRGGLLLRTHRARHDRTKEFGALSKPNGKPRRPQNVA